MTPTVSICVPTRDRSVSLRATLQAIFAQSFQDFEIIVGDDASSDDTPDIVREFTDHRLRYVRRHSNLGIYPNWNALISEARGRFVCVYHDHDTYLPSIVERSLDLLEKHADMSFVHTAIVLVDRAGVPLDVFAHEFDEKIPGRVLQERVSRTTRNTICAASTMVRRDAYAAAGPFDPRYGLPADRQMWFRLAGLGSVGYVAQPQALILGRTKGDPTERFALQDLLGNYRITVDALGALWEPASLERWAIERHVRREVERDLVAAMLKSIVFGTPAEIVERARVVSAALPPHLATAVQAARRLPLRPLVKVAAGRRYARHLAARQDRAMAYCQASPVLRAYLPVAHRETAAPAGEDPGQQGRP